MAEYIDIPPQLSDGIADSTDQDKRSEITLTIAHHGKPLEFHFPDDATITDLSETVAESLSIPIAYQKFMVASKIGILKAPFREPELPLASLLGKKITLIGSTATEIQALDEAVLSSRSRSARRSGRLGGTARPARRHDWRKEQDEAIYTFTTLRPLPYLPDPERSLRFLERLRDDPGIKATMRKHKWTVPLLTEMNPAEHTTHESRTLGLNRNRGEVIELRLRTDAYDGYRDYKTIRKTLCHELTHNVWGDHDRNFWDLCKQIEKEVEAADWTRGGHQLTNDEFYNPADEGVSDDDHMDGGGWTGGEFVLGAQGSGQAAGAGQTTGLSRREILARAAEERLKKHSGVAPDNGGASSSRGAS